MLQLLRDLLVHKGWADATLLSAIRANDAAASDPEVRSLLEHILLANRFWLANIRGVPFDLAKESEPLAVLDDLIERYRVTNEHELAFIESAQDTDLARVLKLEHIPGGQCSVAEGLMQVCMHSHGHRAQCAKMLRRHGATPPMTDFIWWLASRPAADWPVALRPGTV